jgi:transcriptional regulator with XRE-family HTH domain
VNQPNPDLLSEQIRRAVRDSGMSMLAVARAVETDKATMSRFLSGERGLRLSTIDKLGALLGLRLVARRPRKSSKS